MILNSRAAWNAGRNGRSDRGALNMGGLLGITVHWPGGGTNLTHLRGQAVARQLRTWQAEHRRKQPTWSDIGYNYLIDGAGVVWEGCGLVRGAHAGSGEGNRRTVGVQLITGTNEGPTAAQVAALAEFRSWVLSKAPRADNVYPHSHWTGTECPGDRIRSLLPQIAAGNTPTPEEDMPLTRDDAELVADVLMTRAQTTLNGLAPKENLERRIARIAILSSGSRADVASLSGAVDGGSADEIASATAALIADTLGDALTSDVKARLREALA